MSTIVDPRSVTTLPITNIAVPTTLIVLVLLVVGLISGGLLFGLVYLFYLFSRESKEQPGK
ncbi:hypothetical protein SAMN04488556_3779 [Halostagnicola kamekurae]|uniref:Uncharacterized protein n=1 Tax=Halostagnicola kamekurae TaxID=619731 RepID=A0A1I6UDN8_9EURY|nr:hypothetical protein SAMN04488556_3779 [Halostagnicola kamekurae]